MSSRDSLLRGILDRPADDAQRLIYADYIDEHPEHESDHARAEYIRLAIRRPEKSRAYFDAHYHTSWCGVLGELANVRVSPLTGRPDAIGTFERLTFLTEWSRGFIKSICGPGDSFLRHAGEILAGHPIERVYFDPPPNLDMDEDLRTGAYRARLPAGTQTRYYSREAIQLATPESLRVLPDGRPWNIIRSLLLDQFRGKLIAFHPTPTDDDSPFAGV